MARKVVKHRKARKSRKVREHVIARAAKSARKWWRSRKASKLPRKKRYWIARKIRLLIREGKKQKQAIAIAYRMAGVARPRNKKVSRVASLRKHAAVRQSKGPAKFICGSYSTGPNICVPTEPDGVHRLFDEGEKRGEMMGMPLATWSSNSGDPHWMREVGGAKIK